MTKAHVETQDRRLYGLIFLAGFMALGHHIDREIRGNRVGWPLNEEVSAFTYSLAIYPVLLIGLYLYRSPGFAQASGFSCRQGSAVRRLLPLRTRCGRAVPPDIIDHYEPRFLGWLAFGWLVAFIGVLVLASVYEATLASRRRRAVRGSPVGQTDRRCRAMRADRRTVRIAVGAELALPALAVLGEVLARPARDPSANRIRTERREID